MCGGSPRTPTNLMHGKVASLRPSHRDRLMVAHHSRVGKLSPLFHHELDQGASPSLWTDRHIVGVF